MLNQCQFIGHMGKDVEVRALQNGDKVANFSLGVSEKWKDKQGNRQSKTEWINCVAYGGIVNVLENYTKKGSKIYVSGKQQTRSWDDREGNKKYMTECVLDKFNGKLVLLDSRPSGDNQQGGYGNQSRDHQAPNHDLDDDIDF